MRLVTRGNLDGLISSVLLSVVEDISSIELVHPQDIVERRVEINGDDIIANLPFHSKCGMWFDHHQLGDRDPRPEGQFRGKHSIAPSVAGVIYGHYSSDKLKRYEPYIKETDRFDSANLTIEDITAPEGLILLGFTIDSRSGLGHFADYFMMLVKALVSSPLEEVMSLPEVKERVDRLRKSNAHFLDTLKQNSYIEGKVVITDFRRLDKVPIGNRFLVYTLYPEANVSLRLQWGPEKKFVAATLGHSILNRSSDVNCGDICSMFGGGGHGGAAGCSLETEKAEDQIKEIIARLNSR